MQHTAPQRPALGIMFVLMSCSSLQFGAAFAVTLFPLFGALAVSVSRLRDAVWVLCALAGMLVLGYEAAVGRDTDYLGLTFALIAGVFWALYIRSSAKVGALVPGASGLAVAMLVGAAFIAPVAAIVPAPQPLWNAAQDPTLLLMIFGTAMFASVIPYSAELMALRNLPQQVFSVLMSMEPAIAAIAGWALLNQETGPIRWLAICLLMTASVGITLTTAKGSSSNQKDDSEDPVPVPLPE